MAKKKQKRKTKKKNGTPKLKLMGIPKDLKPFVLKVFRSRHTVGMRTLVVRDTGNMVAVATLAGVVPTIVRDFPLPVNTHLPESIWRTTQLELAIWYARYIAHHLQPPSAKKERGRRRKIWKKAIARYQQHEQTRAALEHHGAIPKPPDRRKKYRAADSFICIYDPHQTNGDTTFRIHNPACPRLDQQRKRAVRKGGESWVIEARTPQQAVALQLQEFTEDNKGYEPIDFDYCKFCCRPKEEKVKAGGGQ
jgi:hypothetical protein